MRFIVDESTGMAVVQYLRDAGHDVLAVGEVTPQAEDRQVLLQAAREKRIVVTNDKDFGELVFRANEVHCGVLLLRLHDESSANRVPVVRAVLEEHADQLAGRFAVATERGLRIRAARGLS